ncbi:MAG: hypothetical protein EAZ73_16285 [Oscillatoriales cyanobacterium]|nr:MAG: hypothetical protein EAZ83_14405 [Oscillatoriales cyanobacterium]TAF00018.1 MAG: hypothetical protein EAZ79_03940 [Oscillatoriales cyanobacterium]TAF19139.1 MAG: hypothetical protein EAZ73_16285 [Oscillatoriales cyanobacterium]TAF39624.1 MAG: hypothetical protein EAZ69_00530 [Oscillatoriales cyanobacterium]
MSIASDRNASIQSNTVREKIANIFWASNLTSLLISLLMLRTTHLPGIPQIGPGSVRPFFKGITALVTELVI